MTRAVWHANPATLPCGCGHTLPGHQRGGGACLDCCTGECDDVDEAGEFLYDPGECPRGCCAVFTLAPPPPGVERPRSLFLQLLDALANP